MADDYSADTSTTGRLTVYGSVEGRLETLKDYDWFRIDLDSRLAYDFSLRPGSDSSPGQSLYLSVSRDPALGDWQPKIYSTDPSYHFFTDVPEPVLPNYTEPYYAQVRGLQTGSYVLSVTALPDDLGNNVASAASLSAAGQASARLDYRDDRDYFKLPMVAGLTYTVSITTPVEQAALASLLDVHTELEYQGKRGGSSSSHPDQNTTVQKYFAQQTGEHYLRVQGTHTHTPQGEPLNYTVSVSAADVTAPQPIWTYAATSIPVNGSIPLNFNEAVKAGTGTLILRNSSGAVVETFDVQDAGRVTVSGTTLSLNPGHVLFPGMYTVEAGAGTTVLDFAGHATTLVVPHQFNAATLASKEGVYGGWLSGSRHQYAPELQTAIVYAGAPADYQLVQDSQPGGFQIKKPGIGMDVLRGIDRIFFTGSDDVIALSMDGDVGRAFRLYQSALDRTPEKVGLGFWIAVLEGGTKLTDVAHAFIGSAEFQQRFGVNSDNAAFVDNLYRNVLHRAGDTVGVAHWTNALEHGASHADVLVSFSESTENQLTAAALVGNGFAYTTYG